MTNAAGAAASPSWSSDRPARAILRRARSIAPTSSRTGRRWTGRVQAMRVVILSDVGVASGGAERIALLMATLLVKRGLSVDFIVGDMTPDDPDGALGIRFHVMGVKPVHPASTMKALLSGLYNFRVLKFVSEFISATDTPSTVYHLHAWSKALSPSVFSALAPVRGRVFVHVHDFFVTCPNGNYFNFQSNAECGQRALTWNCLRTACSKRNSLDKAWRTIRGFVVRHVLRGHAWRLILIHERMRSAIEAEAGATRSPRTHRNPSEPLRSEPVEAAGQNGFIFIGRLSLEKGPDLACEAARLAGVQLTVAGDGEMRAALECRYPHVRFVGWKSRREIGELFGSARALLVSSRAPEPYSLACVEALRCGLPVIIADSAYLAPELVALGCALSTNVLDHERFASVLVRASHDDSLVARMSERAITASRDIAPTSDEWIDGILNEYAEALQSDPADTRQP